jgi:6-phosphogluconolactonase
MRTNLIKAKGNLFASTTIVSILSFAAILAILASVSVSSSAFGGSTGAVYIIDNSASGNNVWVYARASDGSLSSLGSVAANGLGNGAGLGSQGAVVLTPNGRWLLTVDAGSNAISVFKVHGTTLTFASKTSSERNDPISLTTNGNLVYVLDAAGTGNIAGFTLSQWGKLSFISGSIQPLSGAASPSPEQIGFNNKGNILVVTEKASNTIDTYTVDKSGVASAPDSQTSAGSGPYAFVFNSHDELVVSEAASNSVSSYYISDQGKLTVISSAIPTGGLAPCWIVISGQLSFVANAHGGTISSFQVSNKGKLTIISSTAATTAIPALDMAFTHHSEFLYVHNGASITGYAVDPDGTLSSVASVSGLAASATGLAAS